MYSTVNRKMVKRQRSDEDRKSGAQKASCPDPPWQRLYISPTANADQWKVQGRIHLYLPYATPDMGSPTPISTPYKYHIWLPDIWMQTTLHPLGDRSSMMSGSPP